MATVTSANNSGDDSCSDPMERATSLQVGRRAGLFVLEVTADQMPQFLLGWAACAEAVRRERAQAKDRDVLCGQADAKGPGLTIKSLSGQWSDVGSAEVRPPSMAPGAARYRKPRKSSKKGGWL